MGSLRNRSRRLGRIRFLTLVLLAYWGLLFIATHVPLPAVKVISTNDKVIHFCGYAALAFLAAFAASQSFTLTWKGYLTLLLVFAGYGAVDELLQLIPVLRRSADVEDWIADVAGASTALVIFWTGSLLLKKQPTASTSASSPSSSPH